MRAVVRDVALFWVFTGVGGMIVGLIEKGGRTNFLATAVSNILLSTVVFVISGCLAAGNRWRHLSIVALGTWLTSFANVLLFGFSIGQWAFGIIPAAFSMGMGGAI